MLTLRFSLSKIYAVKCILADFHGSHKKPTLEMIQPKLAILAQFRPHRRILQLIPHRKKSWETIIKKFGNPSQSTTGFKVYEKNLAMQDTTNLDPLVGCGYC